MKFQKLIIHNIASIEDATIDFENGPLSEDSRFLICGPTGAGKTTILDAICLALYGTTPRLNIKKVEAYVDQYENYKLKDRDEVKIDDTRMMMRRGSLSAFVELYFTDKDECPLKAVWQCSRVRNNLQGNVKEPEWLLFDGKTDTLIDDRKSNVLKEISRRIGLTFEQFCRTTMLAQGEFTKFLKSDEGEKSQILEKLTGTTIYSEVSVRIHQLKNEKEAACNQITSMMQGVQLLSDTDVEEILQQQKEQEQKINQLSNEENILKNKVLWKRRLDESVKQLDEVKKRLEGQCLEEKSVTFINEENLLSNWHQTQVQRDLWKDRMLSKQSINKTTEELNQQQEKYIQLVAGIEGLKAKLSEKLRIRDKIKNYLEQEANNERCYKEISVIELLVKHIDEANQQIESSESVIRKNNVALIELGESYRSESENVKKIEQNKEENLTRINTCTASLKSLNYENLLKEKETVEKNIVDLKDFKQLYETNIRLTDEYQTTCKKMQEVESSILLYEKKVEQADKKSRDLEERISKQTDIYEKQERACSNVMKEYRSMLQIGDSCPLCGQTIVNLESDLHFASILQPIKELLENLRSEVTIVNKELSEDKAKLSLYKSQLVTQRKECLTSEEQLTLNIKRLEQHPFYGSYKGKEQTLVLLETTLENLDGLEKQLNEKLAAVGKQQNSLALLQQERDRLATALRQTEARKQAIQQKQATLTESTSLETKTLNKAYQTIDEKMQNLSSYVDIDKFKQQGSSYIAVLKLGAERFKIANDRAVSVETHIQEISNELRYVEQLKNNIDKQQETWKLQAPLASCHIDNLSNAWMELQTKVSRVSEALHIAENHYKEVDSALDIYFNEQNSINEERLRFLSEIPQQEIEKLEKEHQLAHELHIRLAAQVENIEKTLAEHKKGMPLMNDEETLEYLLREEEVRNNEIKEHIQQLGKLSQSLDDDKKNKSRYESIRKSLEKAKDEYEKWAHLHKLFGSNDGKKFRNIAQSYVLEQLLVNANQYLRQFTNRYEMECQPGSLTILLKDKEAGGVLRPTTTISGGESFLISLSLALGLSSLSRSTLTMDTLFIDEGFGTLDSSYLSSVMDALERLHQIGGKKVGIISHVESLKERITTQIQVSRITNTLSKVNVVSLI